MPGKIGKLKLVPITKGYIKKQEGEKRMKFKAISIISAMILTVGVLAGCGAKTPTTPTTTPSGTSAPTETAWPTKTVEVLVTASAGGDTDFNARTFAKYFEKITGQTMIITNMGGGGGSVATSQVKNATADGNTILFTHTGPMIVNEVAGLVDYGYDAFEIAAIPAVDKGVILVASKQSGLKDAADLVAKAKAEPGKIVFGTELGGYSHLQGLMLMDQAGIDLKVVDVGSASEKVTNLLGGRVDVAAISYGTIQDYLKTGDMVALGQFSAERNTFLGDIKTLTEQGLNFAMEKPYIIALPKGTDPKIVKKMSDIAKQISANPDYAKDLETGFKQPVTVYETADAIKLIKETRDEFFKFQALLKK